MHAVHETRPFKLSVCIPTYNRAKFLAEALESVISQAPAACEIVVSDNASTDHTPEIVSDIKRRFPALTYVRQETNIGLDRNFDAAVSHAHGEYCWLLGDDDVLKPGAIKCVLEVLKMPYSLVLVNGEYWDVAMSELLVRDFFNIGTDRLYAPTETDRFFAEMGKCSICISCFVIRRDVWISRSREQFFGTMWIHVGITFQQPLPNHVKAVAKPLLRLRWGNDKEWMPDAPDIFFVRWPKLIWSLPLSEQTKRRHCAHEPWRRLRYLLPLRAMGAYSRSTYMRLIRPNLHSATEKLVPILVLLIPPPLARGIYTLHSLATGKDSVQEVLRANSTVPESLHPLLGLGHHQHSDARVVKSP